MHTFICTSICSAILTIPHHSLTHSLTDMHGYIKNAPVNTLWSMNPKLGVYLPLGLTYIVAYLAPDSSYTLISVPDRSYLWIMTRARPLPEGVSAPPVTSDKV